MPGKPHEVQVRLTLLGCNEHHGAWSVLIASGPVIEWLHSSQFHGQVVSCVMRDTIRHDVTLRNITLHILQYLVLGRDDVTTCRGPSQH